LRHRRRSRGCPATASPMHLKARRAAALRQLRSSQDIIGGAPPHISTDPMMVALRALSLVSEPSVPGRAPQARIA
jgi:hypothetical protein